MSNKGILNEDLELVLQRHFNVNTHLTHSHTHTHTQIS